VVHRRARNNQRRNGRFVGSNARLRNFADARRDNARLCMRRARDVGFYGVRKNPDLRDAYGCLSDKLAAHGDCPRRGLRLAHETTKACAKIIYPVSECGGGNFFYGVAV